MMHIVFLSLMLVISCSTEENRPSSIPTMKAAQLTIASSNQTAIVGEDITFTCTIVTNDPQSYLVLLWLRNLDYSKIINEIIASQSDTNTSIILDIKNVKKEDEGLYTCSAVNNVVGSLRSAWLTVLSDGDIPPPVNMTVLRTPLGMLVRWEQQITSIPVDYYRVYHRKTGIENAWKSLDTNASAIHILLSDTLKNEIYDMKVQTRYSNGIYSRNVSATVLVPDEDSEYKIYLLTGIWLILLLSVCILGFVRIWRYHALHSINGQPQGVQSQGQGMNGGGICERAIANTEEINHYELIISTDVDVRQPLAPEQPYAEIELDSLTTPKVTYNDNNYESANYIHPVAATIGSSGWERQYVHGRLPEASDSTNYIHPVAATMGSSDRGSQYVHGRLPEDSESTNYIRPVAATMGSSDRGSQYVHGRLPEDSESTNYIRPVAATMGSSDRGPQYVHGRLPEASESTNYIHPVAATMGSSDRGPQITFVQLQRQLSVATDLTLELHKRAEN